jgi:hypothetical protein
MMTKEAAQIPSQKNRRVSGERLIFTVKRCYGRGTDISHLVALIHTFIMGFLTPFLAVRI